MKTKTYSALVILSCALFLASCNNNKPKWKQLFNGKDLKDWQIKIRTHPLNDNYANTFSVKDGNIQVRYNNYGDFNQQYGHLFYKKPYAAYLIGVEYRFVGEQAKGGEGWAIRNSGLMLHGQSPNSMTIDQDFPNSIEMQLLGGNGKDERTTANICTPGTQYVFNDEIIQQHCANSSSKTFHGDQWVRAEALVLRDSLIVHYVNGEEVLRYTKPQLDPKNGTKEGKLLTSGSISLQSESHPVDFRKVEIVNLEKFANDPTKLKEVIEELLSKN
ncbi:3-keto-disaccharide hydrolase [Cellulophaga fucicola]|uniref:3-keto-disaccharide hydrolase n=1 Tax=Cellulophaga fucicola TaxID=76595 RepID=UPI003EBFF92E